MTRSTGYWCGFVSSLALLAPDAFAQAVKPIQTSSAQIPPAEGAQSDRQIGEIIVTAQRRSENLVKVPVSVTALSADTVAKLAITTQRDLQIAVPGLSVRAAFNSDQLNYSIRGQTIDPFTYSQPGVLPYLNEYSVPAGFSASTLFDLESVQVLKGPQGTLFGRNAIGGAVLFTTVKPSDHFEGYAKVRVGDYTQRVIEGAVNIPLGEQFALRVSGQHTYDGGFFRNLTTGNRVGQEKHDSVRGSLLFKPTDLIQNTLVIDYTVNSGTTTPGRLYSVYPPGATNNGITLPSPGSFLFSPGVDALFGPGFFATYIAGLGLTGTPAAGGITSYFNSIKNQSPNSDVRLNADPRVSGKVFNLVNTTVFKASDKTAIKSIIGYTHSKSSSIADADGSPFAFQTTQVAANIEQVTAELQLTSKALHDHLDYVAGVYYVHADTRTDLGTPTSPVLVFSFAPAGPTLSSIYLNGLGTDEAIAAYAQGTYSLTDKLKATAGIRYTRETQRLEQLLGGNYYDKFGPAPESDTINRVNYQGILQYFFSSRFQVYGKVGSSFRSGGFNVGSAPIAGTAATGGNGFLPESTTAFELGGKVEGRLGNAPARVTIALFDQDVKNVQRAVYFTPPGGALAGFTANVPRSRVRGLEFEGYISPITWLQFGANLAYTDAKFTRATSTFFGTSKTYGPYPDTPEISGSIYSQATFPLGGKTGNLSLRGDLYHQSHTFFSSLNDTTVPGTELSGYTVANFRVAVEDIDKKGITIAAYVKNAFDKGYYVGGIPTGEVFSVNSAVPGPPRTWFIEASVKF